MTKSTTKRAVKPKKGAWFYPVRGSYLPCSWQAWLLYLVATVYILVPFVAAVRETDTSLIASIAGFVSRILISGIVLTWIAQKHA